jgi:hypothetical protein
VGFGRAGEIGSEPQNGFAIAPDGCAKSIAGRCEQRLSIAADAALPPNTAASCARFEARGPARLTCGKADDKPVIGSAIAPVPAEGNEDLAREQRQRAVLVLQRGREPAAERG